MAEGNRMRVTMHCGRVAESSKHNDRQFDATKTDHIHPERSKNNVYYQWNQNPVTKERPGTFEEAEKEFYEEHFSSGLQARNAKYVKYGHRERVKTMDQYRKAINSRPDETIWMIGNLRDKVSPELLNAIIKEQLEWQRIVFPQVYVLDVALHVDEYGGPHIHERFVWIGHDNDGNEIVGQKKALNEMGIERPEPDMPEGRYNNSKMTYTKLCREHFVEICKEHGIDVETEPKEASKTGLKLLQYQYQDIVERVNTMLDIRKQLLDDKRLRNALEIQKALDEYEALRAFISRYSLGNENLLEVFDREYENVATEFDDIGENNEEDFEL